MKNKLFVLLLLALLPILVQGQVRKKRIGIIGLDTSHATTFAAFFNGPTADPEFSDYVITAAYPWGSKTIEIGYTRVPGFIEKVEALGVKIAGSIKELLDQVDYVMLETQDGRLHIDQVLEVFKAGKPVFIDKPLATNTKDVCLIFELGKKYNVPVYSSSSFRWIDAVLEVKKGALGKVVGVDCFGPCNEEPSHPALYWYGIHGVEMMYTLMGTGCETVSRIHTEETDVMVGVWKDKRIGTFKGMRTGKAAYYHYGGFAQCEKGTIALDKYEGYGYKIFLREMLKFFETGIVPVSHEDTIEIYAFMDASNLSLKKGGKPVRVDEIIEKSKKTALKEVDTYFR